MLEIAHLVMPGFHRTPSLVDRVACLRRQVGVVARVLEFCLDMILAALDFVDDRLIVGAGDDGLEIQKRAVSASQYRAVILGIAAKAVTSVYRCVAAWRRS